MDKTQLEKLIAQSLSTREIADRTGKSQTAIRHWLKKYGLKTKINLFNRGGESQKPKRQRKPCLCKKCGESDPKKFYIGGKKRLKHRCRKCHSRETIERFREYKKLAVAYKGGKCVRCGYDKCVAALDFHHTDPSEKDPRWRLMRNWKFDRIKDELDKCILVCSNCHDEIHYGV